MRVARASSDELVNAIDRLERLGLAVDYLIYCTNRSTDATGRSDRMSAVTRESVSALIQGSLAKT
jgi:hypothetical protein